MDVSPYQVKYEPEQKILIVKARTSYTDSTNGITYILTLSQALYFKDLDHSLLNPNQL